MMQFDRISMGRTAKKLGFVRDTLEKVCRLADVLRFMEADIVLSETLALKGGTAINLTIFDLPRLSVDIDLDYSKETSRDGMLEERKTITDKICKYMTANGYTLSVKSKNYHALDSFVFEYINAGGMKDNLKIEINYMLRCHVLPLARRMVYLPWDENELSVLSVAPLEIFASKTVALLSRSAPRDLYDMHNMVRFGLFDEGEQDLLRKCAVYYSAIAAETPPDVFDFSKFGELPMQKIKTDLYPVLRKGERFDLKLAQTEVGEFLNGILLPTNDEICFWNEFRQGNYCPQLIFGDSEETENIRNHPMAIWKCNKNKL